MQFARVEFKNRMSKPLAALLVSVIVPPVLIVGVVWLNTKVIVAPANEKAAVAASNSNGFRQLKGAERKAAGAERYISQRMYGLGYIPQDANIEAVEYVRTSMIPALQAQQRLQKSSAASLLWKYHGPGNIGGRLRGVVVHPDNPNIIYAGSVSGGVWKSTNGGVSWFPTMNDLITLNISALAMKPGDPNTLYAGTGEGYFLTDNLPGHGILKTTDGGNTWKRVHIAQGLNSPFITAIAVSPADPSVVYAAGRQAAPKFAETYPPVPVETLPEPGVSAIFKSTDSGETWQDMTSGKVDHYPSAISDDFAADVIVSPTNAEVIYATFGLYAPGGIWKSVNGGQTWSRLRSGLPNANLRNAGYGRIKLAMAPSDPEVLYASFTYDRKSGDTVDLPEGGMLGIWKTTNGGQSWTKMTTPLTSNQFTRDQGMTTALGNQGNYATALIVHPTDPNTVFVGGLDIYKTIDGGNTWSQVSIRLEPGSSANPENLPYVHADHHVFAFDLSSNPPTLYNGSDGGVARSRDLGKTWEILNKDLGVTQFYTLAVHPTNPEVMLGGTQDNGTPMLLSVQDNLWRDITRADGWQAYFDYTDPTRIYCSQQQLSIYQYTIDYAAGSLTASKNIGYTNGSNGITLQDAQKADFFPPYELSPNNANVLVLGTNRILQSKNRGDNWTPISPVFSVVPIATVAVGEGNDGVIWAATYNAKIFKTENNGASWTEVTHPILPTRFITDIEFDPSDIKTVYLTYSGYSTPHVFKTTDAGASWTNITNNLPDIPVNTIQVHPLQPHLLFVGTDIGMFLSDDGGTTWQPCTNGLPTVQVAAIVVNVNVNRVYAATHGRGVYSAELNNAEYAELKVEPAEIALQIQPGKSRSTTFEISNGGNRNLNYSIVATGPDAATGVNVTAILSNSANANERKLPGLNLATARMRPAQGVTPVLFAKTSAAQTSPNTPGAMSGAEVLALDDGDNNADTFIGFGPSSTNGFTWANVFTAPEFGFQLESFDFYMRTEYAEVDSFHFAIADTHGVIFAQGSSILPPSPPRGGWYRVPLNNPLTFNAGSSFSLVVGVRSAIGFPAGADVDAAVPNHSFYFDLALNRYVPLGNVSGLADGAFLIRANGTKADAINRLSASPDSGTISPGNSQTITLTFEAQGLAEGNYYGQLNITSNGGERSVPVSILVSNTVRVDEDAVAMPRAFSLEQNYPNPFNPETSIRYALPHEGNVTLAVFDLNGRRVALLESGLKTAGQHLTRWNGRDSAGNRVPSGVYFYRLEVTASHGGVTSLTKKLTVLK